MITPQILGVPYDSRRFSGYETSTLAGGFTSTWATATPLVIPTHVPTGNHTVCNRAAAGRRSALLLVAGIVHYGSLPGARPL